MQNRWLLALSVLGWATAGSTAARGADTAPSAAPLAFLRQSVPSRGLVRLEILGTAEWAFGKGAQRSRSFRLVCTYLRDGQRLDVQTTRYEGGRPISAWRSIIDGFYISYPVPPRGSTALSGMYAAEGGRFVGAAIPSGWGGFEGYAAGDYLSLSQILQSAAQVQVGQDQVDGSACVLLQVDSPDHGRYQAWLDPAMNYLPRKLLVQKTVGHFMGNLRLSQWTRISPSGSRGTVALTAVSYTMDQTTFERIGDRWFPLTCRVMRIQSFADGNSETTVMNCRRTQLVLDPDLTALGAFRPQLRQGAPLANQVDRYLPYQWKDGAAVPRVDARVLAQMEQTAATLKQESTHSGGEGR
jgi:hypothetical protein